MVNCDSPYQHIRERSEAVINEEINYCMHLSISNIVLQLPLTPSVDNFAKVLNNFCSNVIVSSKFILQIPIVANEADFLEIWEKYLRIKRLTKHSVKISCILDFQPDMPEEHLLERFLGESVYAIAFD